MASKEAKEFMEAVFGELGKLATKEDIARLEKRLPPEKKEGETETPEPKPKKGFLDELFGD